MGIPGLKLEIEFGDVLVIKKMYNDADYSQEYIGSLFGVRQTTISKIIRGERKSSRNKETNDNAQVLVF